MKTGGRVKGTPNKDNPIKGFIKSHSLTYFEPKPTKVNGQTKMMSEFDKDLEELAPDERVNAELKLLEFHTPKMKAVDIAATATLSVNSIEDKLRALVAGEDLTLDDADED